MTITPITLHNSDRTDECGIYRCDKIIGLHAPQNEVEVDRAPNFDAARKIAIRLKRADPDHSYTVGCA